MNTAVGIFQRAIENILKGLKGVSVYLDDILITGSNIEEHLQNLQQVLLRLQENGMKLQKAKCQFLLLSVEYLGFRVSAEGLHPTETKVRAITESPPPTNLNELRQFIGLVNYYGRFLPSLATHMAPLYALLKNNYTWRWTSAQ